MNIFDDYKISEKFYDDSHYHIYRATRQSDRIDVLLKTIPPQLSNLKSVTWLKNEYQILQNLNLTGIIKPYRLQKYNNSLALILEDFAGEFLDQFLELKKPLQSDFLTIAIQLVTIIQELHQNQIIHKNLQPSSILINPETLEVKITNFDIATNVVKENPNSQQLEATNIAYISPEQTGRMNLPLDYRTDLYSLGVIFYQILTGKLPCQAEDSLQLMHCHLAQTPDSPHQLNPDIDETISSIVMKLLAKNPEDRYQSANGIKADLEICQIQYQHHGKIKPFDLGTIDRRSQFVIPQKLYGRSSAIDTLVSSLDRVYSGATEIILVSGSSGMGKTSVICEVTKPIVKQKDFFLTGKFEQLKRNIPYEAIIQAFRSLIRQLLTENTDNIKVWQEKILSVVGKNGKVITDIIPELELIIGSQPDVIKLPTKENQNRFNTVFEKFVRIFAQQEHPLVMFLDDLQWADSASLKLIELLLSNSNSQYLLIIGAYRDDEVNSTHPLIQTIEKIQQNTRISNIALQPLTCDDINQLLVDTLHCQPEQSCPLAELLFDRTRGNPFFLNQLLQTLHAEKLLTFNFSSWSWQWQLEEIQSTPISNFNVLELVVRNIEKLPQASQEVLKFAACIGNQFDLAILAIASGGGRSAIARNHSQAEINQELANLLQAGIILQVQKQPNPTYKFLHDRVQQAAYSLLNEAEKKRIHLQIGQFLLEQTSPTEIEEKIFNLVNHLNIGRDLITEDSFTNRLGKLNLLAGKKAKTANAYELAANYLDTALELLSPSSWEDNYDLTLKVYLQALEVQYMQTNFERAEQLGNTILIQARSVLEKVRVHKIRIHAYIAQNQMQLAVDTGWQVLSLLKIPLPDDPKQAQDLQALLNFESDYSPRTLPERIESFKNLPEMADDYSKAALEILATIIPPIYIVKPQLFPLAALTMVDLCLHYGNSRLSPVAYALYGLLLCAKGNIDAGYQLGKLALKLQEQFDVREIKPKVDFIFNNMIRHWREPAISTLDPFLKGIQEGIEVGDVEHACFHATNYCAYLFFAGEPLPSADKKSFNQISIIQNFKQDFQFNYARIWRQLNLNLQGLAEDKLLLIGESFNESKMLPLWLEANDAMSLFAFYLAKMILYYFLKDFPQAIEHGRKGKQYLEAAVGRMGFSVYHFYCSLAMLAIHRDKLSIELTDLQEIISYQQLIRQWAVHAPENNLHKYELIAAEMARVLGKNEQAIEHYDKAITEAGKSGYTHEAALAEELAGEFYLSQGKTKIAGYYLTDAYYGYWRWGALTKVRDLEAKYSELLTRIPITDYISAAHWLGKTDQDSWRSPPIEALEMLSLSTLPPPLEKTSKDNSSASSDSVQIDSQSESLATLDLFSVIKASQAISSEIILDNLLSKMMEIVMENAGAQKSILFLQQNSSWIVAAAATMIPEKNVDLPYIPVAEYLDLPHTIFNYIQSSRSTVILDRASKEGMFTNDPYIIEYQPESILGCPMIYKNQLQGMIYLENKLISGAFTPEKLEVLKVLLSQVSISIENARLYKNLEDHASVKKSLKQKEILLKEIHHRVKNNLFVVSSLLEFQSSYVEDPEIIKLLENCQSRITSMALVHQHLYGTTSLDRINFAQYVNSLLDNLTYSQGCKERNINFVVDIEDMELNIETANPCGLIINELVSNALEHGFCDRDSGNIWLSLKQNLEGQKVLTIQDDGVGFADDKDLYNSDSLGLELVCTLVEQLEGEIKLDKTNGTKIEIFFDELDYKSRI
ncbi:AAA family ATPase [Pleurocapsa sp. PCC 7319]|uniref:AAA family ATPase n=1 Tax=Pleurocapsa sp. PCC 7319 TaxID=118161 RepID=UPI00034CC59A|nr:AAA family ATPase [Pleurocapsa sp. PCC 7319]